MFYDCNSLTSLDLSSFDTLKVTDMGFMFYQCYELASLDVSHFDTSNVKNMEAMFCDCDSLTSLDVSHFDTSKVTNMGGMFVGATGLTSIDVSHFDTSKATNIDGMFEDCYSLTSLDLSSFNTSNVRDMGWIFYDCRSLTTIYANDTFVTSALTDTYAGADMFYACTNLVGGNGTTYNSNYTDDAYARVDTAGTPGYFTYKAAEPASSFVPPAPPTQPSSGDTAPNGSEIYPDKATVNFVPPETGIVILHALWDPIKYKVRFNAPDAESGSMDDQVMVYDKEDALTETDFFKRGYTIVGWSLTPGGEMVYTDGQVVKNLTSIEDDIVNLYAIWDEIETTYADPTKKASKERVLPGAAFYYTVSQKLNNIKKDYSLGDSYASLKFEDIIRKDLQYDYLNVLLYDKQGNLIDGDFGSKGTTRYDAETKTLTWEPNNIEDIPLDGGRIDFQIYVHSPNGR